MEKLTTAELKRVNRKNILKFIYRERKTAKQEIAAHLRLSLPPVTQCLRELIESGLIEKNGYFESSGGRKAEGITFVASAKLAVGIELLIDSVHMVAINLYGNIVRQETLAMLFRHHDDYYAEVCRSVLEFIGALRVSSKRLLGIGIVLQGLVSSDGKEVTYGKILGCTGLTIDRFTRHLPYPCIMIHDAEAAANVELWHSPSMKDAIFFHIRSNLSGAIIVGGKFLKGIELKSGVFEHMTIVLDGKPCYCGKRGCMDAYCSLRMLDDNPSAESIAAFFARLDKGETAARARWAEYLYYLAMAIDNVHMLMDSNVILGGYLARYIKPSDIHELLRLVRERSAFPTQREFIKNSLCSDIPFAKGGALPFAQTYLDGL
ncbi:MAG: ROK family transcriptional regulator [Candidatus Accumulibacter sp.]|jgi:predicted NBD/HSP70 family sugar kinase|nr:ROK family transcriptional regulator [Accumulibacter sp.]